MTRPLFFLALLLVLPAGVSAAPAKPPHPPPACAPLGKGKGGKHPPIVCLFGKVTQVSAHDIHLKPKHGHATVVRLSASTVFQTNSGPGALNGVMPGDFACVSGTVRGHALVARVVVFDLTPFPCPVPHGAPHPPS